jgi:hypothetical protein
MSDEYGGVYTHLFGLKQLMQKKYGLGIGLEGHI